MVSSWVSDVEVCVCGSKVESHIADWDRSQAAHRYKKTNLLKKQSIGGYLQNVLLTPKRATMKQWTGSDLAISLTRGISGDHVTGVFQKKFVRLEKALQ